MEKPKSLRLLLELINNTTASETDVTGLFKTVREVDISPFGKLSLPTGWCKDLPESFTDLIGDIVKIYIGVTYLCLVRNKQAGAMLSESIVRLCNSTARILRDTPPESNPNISNN